MPNLHVIKMINEANFWSNADLAKRATKENNRLKFPTDFHSHSFSHQNFRRLANNFLLSLCDVIGVCIFLLLIGKENIRVRKTLFVLCSHADLFWIDAHSSIFVPPFHFYVSVLFVFVFGSVWFSLPQNYLWTMESVWNGNCHLKSRSNNNSKSH